MNQHVKSLVLKKYDKKYNNIYLVYWIRKNTNEIDIDYSYSRIFNDKVVLYAYLSLNNQCMEDYDYKLITLKYNGKILFPKKYSGFGNQKFYIITFHALNKYYLFEFNNHATPHLHKLIHDHNNLYMYILFKGQLLYKKNLFKVKNKKLSLIN